MAKPFLMGMALILVMAFVVACGSAEESEATDVPAEAPTTAPTNTTAPEPTNTPEAVEPEEEEERKRKKRRQCRRSTLHWRQPRRNGPVVRAHFTSATAISAAW